MLSEERIEEIATEVASPVSRYLPYWRTAVEFARAIEAECAKVPELDVLAEYTGKDGKREWKDVGSWLRPGECIAVIEAENLEQARLLGMSAEREADLRGEVERLTTALKKAREALNEVTGLIEESSGVYGLPPNDDLSPWDELVQGGRFERLGSLNEAIATIDEALK